MRFKTPLDRRSKIITLITLLLLVGAGSWVYIRAVTSFLPAWVTVVIIAVLLILAMSIPKFIDITRSSLEIHCLVELTNIPLSDIRTTKILHKHDMRWCIPIPVAGIYGILGYYGYYLNLRNFELVKVYARRWGNFVMIENIYEQTFIVSVPDPETFIEQIQRHASGQKVETPNSVKKN